MNDFLLLIYLSKYFVLTAALRGFPHPHSHPHSHPLLLSSPLFPPLPSLPSLPSIPSPPSPPLHPLPSPPRPSPHTHPPTSHPFRERVAHTRKCSSYPLLTKTDRDNIAVNLLEALNAKLQNKAREVTTNCFKLLFFSINRSLESLRDEC